MNTFMRAAVSPKNMLLIGRCLAHEIPKEAKVRVNTLEFDSYLNMYFSKYSDFVAHDSREVCKDGDVVLIRLLKDQVKMHITHDIVKILYAFGDVTDPITGQKCVSGKYRTMLKFEKEMYGKAEDADEGFDYETAPDRGWQEGKKDFTYKVGYLKYHEFPKGHPKHNDPAAI